MYERIELRHLIWPINSGKQRRTAYFPVNSNVFSTNSITRRVSLLVEASSFGASCSRMTRAPFPTVGSGYRALALARQYGHPQVIAVKQWACPGRDGSRFTSRPFFMRPPSRPEPPYPSLR